MTLKKLAVWACLFLLVVGGRALAQGVGASGDVKGTVVDPTGAILPGATVTVANVEKGVRRTAVTDERGEYRISGLAPAAYDVSAELQGFETQVRKGVVVTVGLTVVVVFELKVSAVVTEVVVTEQPPLVETEKTHQANTVNEQYIRQLPIDRRDYLTYTLLMPGVVDSNAFSDNTDFRVTQTPQSGLSFYGSNGRGNSVTVDGAEANDDGGAVRLTLSQEAVQEFQINRSNYSAEFGGASGGVINIVSKSGTNDVHGSGYIFFRHDALDARDPFAFDSALAPGQPFSLTARGAPVDPPSDREQFGGTLGFPVRKDKTFLFVSYEGLRRDESAAVPVLTRTSIFAPTAAQEAILAGLPAATAAALRGVLTIDPTTPEATPFRTLAESFLVNQFIRNSGIFPFTARRDLVSVRFDHQINDRNQVFLRYNLGDSRERNTNLRALVGFSRGNLIENFDSTIVLGWYRQISPRLQNEARGQWNYYTFDVTPNDPLGPELNLAGFGFFNRDIFLPSFTTGRRYEVSDNLTFITGRHKTKFGGSLLVHDNETESHTFFPGRFNFGPLPGALVSPALATTTITALQAFKLGLPQFYQQGFDNPTVESALPFIAFYGQDTWTPRSNLTLNFGLRYEYDRRYRPLRSDKNNFAPRFAFSWDPLKDRKSVVRGGYGIFYSPIYYQIDYVALALGVVDDDRNQVRNLVTCATSTCIRQIAQVFVPFGLAGVTANTIFQTLLTQGVIGCTATTAEACITPANLTQFGINITHTGPIPARTVIFSGADDYVNAYSQQGSLGVERELISDFSVSADYIYSRTLKITRARDKNNLPAPIGPLGIRQWNLPPPSPCAVPTVPNACFADFRLLQDNVYESTGRAFYHGLILAMNKRFSHHFSFSGSYTWSHAIDEVTDFNSDFQPNDQTNLRAERADSAFDQRHKLVLYAVLESPWKGGPDASPLERIFAGFSVSPIFRANSGRPFNLLTGADTNGDRHSTTDRPPGAPRNVGRGPNFRTFDLRVNRTFGFAEARKLEVIFEAFNLFNRLNFGSVNNTVGVIAPPFSLAGRSDRSPSDALGFTSALDTRRIQLGLRFSF